MVVGIDYFLCLALLPGTVIWSAKENDNFYENDHFERKNDMTPQSVLESLIKTYEENKWDKIEKLHTKNMQVPYLYLEPKMKNFEKYRPIASYYLHPLKKVYKVAGQGLMVILKTIETSHMNIFSTYDTKSKIEAIFNEINSFEEQHNCQPNIQTYAGDIKQLHNGSNDSPKSIAV